MGKGKRGSLPRWSAAPGSPSAGLLSVWPFPVLDVHGSYHRPPLYPFLFSSPLPPPGFLQLWPPASHSYPRVHRQASQQMPPTGHSPGTALSKDINVVHLVLTCPHPSPLGTHLHHPHPSPLEGYVLTPPSNPSPLGTHLHPSPTLTSKGNPSSPSMPHHWGPVFIQMPSSRTPSQVSQTSPGTTLLPPLQSRPTHSWSHSTDGPPDRCSRSRGCWGKEGGAPQVAAQACWGCNGTQDSVCCGKWLVPSPQRTRFTNRKSPVDGLAPG